MGLREEVQAVPRYMSPCSMASIISQLDPEDRTELDDILADRRVLGSTIAAVLTARGFKVQGQTVQRHRRRACNCP